MGDTAMLREVNRENAGMALAKDARFWEAQTWNTPKANDAEKRGNVAVRSNAPELVAQAGHWCTPNASPLSSSTTLQCSGDGRELPNKLGWQISQWMTPNVPNGGRSVSEELVASKGTTPEGDKRTVGLESQTKFWATPQARDQKSANSADSGNYQRKLEQGYTIDLNSQAHNWLTPVSNDDNKTPKAHLAMKSRMVGGPRNTITSLQVLAQVWPESSPQAQAIPDGEPSSPPTPGALPPSAKRLNPYFVEWLMGWPANWTLATVRPDSGRAETELYRARLHTHLCSYINAQQ